MIDPTRTAFASTDQPEELGRVLLFPADRSLAAIRRREAQELAGDQVRVEYRGRTRTYPDVAALEADLAQARAQRGPTAGDRLRSWGWLLVLGLCAVAVIRGAL